MKNQSDLTTSDTSDITYALAPVGYPIPMGTIMAFYKSANAIPLGWLPCDGASVDSSKYPEFASQCGTITPNLGGVTLIGAGGQDIQQTGTPPFVLTQTGGQQAFALSEAQMPSHQHYGWGETGSNPWGTGTSNGQNYYGSKSTDSNNSLFGSTFAGGTTTNTIDTTNGTTALSAGTTQVHNNMQPFCVVTYMIFTGYLPV